MYLVLYLQCSYYLKNKLEYLDEVVNLEYEEWANNKEENKKDRIKAKKEKILNSFNNKSFCKLILIDNNNLIGFISIFPKDCKDDILIGFISIFPKDGDERQDLSPWYATMYVKERYRNNGYSRILNDAILNEARNRGFSTLYLKTDLKNYYEKFGAIFIKKLKSGEDLYKFEL